MRCPRSTVAVAAVLGLLVVPVSGRAASLVCTSQSDFAWTAVDDAVSSDWDCVDADSPGADDHFVIEHEVTIAGDILQDGVTPGTGITVADGGALLALAPVTISLNDAGLVCQSGSTCRFTGAYREFGSATPQLLAAPDPSQSFVVGDVVPCPDAGGASDCSQPALRELVRIDFPSTTYGPGGPSELPNVCASVGAVDDGGGVGAGDVIAFWNPDPADLDEGPDTNFWYEIAAVTGGASCSIDFSVHQGVNDQDGYPLARREVARYAPSVSIAAGDRTVELPAATLPAADYHDGRMLRLERGGVPSSETYRIHDTVIGATAECADQQGPCDLLRIADHRGFAQASDVLDPDEDEVWVDYGWETGNPFLVVSPVRIRAAAPARGSVPIRFAGTTELLAVVFYRTDTVDWQAEANDGCRDLWLEDLFSGDADKLFLSREIDCERLSITGGDPSAAEDISHTIVARTSQDITLRVLGLRHGGDDFFSVHNGFTPTVVFDRYRGQFKSANAPSDECIATGGDPVTVIASDVECIDGANSGAVFGPGSGDFEANAVMVIASRGPLWGSTFNYSDPEFTDVTIVGSDLPSSNHELIPLNTDRFVVRDSSVATGRLVKSGTGYARNGIVADNQVGNSLAITAADTEMDNVAILRTRRDGGATELVSSLSDPATAVWRNVLFLEPAGAPTYGFLWRFRNTLTDLSGFTLEGVAFVDGDVAILNQSGIALDDPVLGVDFEGPLCFFGNATDANATTLAQLPAASLHGVDPEFVDPASDRYEVSPGSPWDLAACGVRRGADAPGVRDFLRVHAWSNLAPQIMAGACDDGSDDDGDGWIDFPADPGCLSPADEAETEASLPCDDGIDNDGDLLVDAPDDPGCAGALSPREDPQCQDGVDNDFDGLIDWDGGGQGPADPHCNGLAYRNSERPAGQTPKSCGLGLEAVAALCALAGARRRRRPRVS